MEYPFLLPLLTFVQTIMEKEILYETTRNKDKKLFFPDCYFVDDFQGAVMTVTPKS
ncbi:hypothetical protein H6G56_12405 [Anabaena variabilis FACHB-164]|uniref:Uncharacterized protein n=1 Tax=Trichormus variabilis SAG 1403-4b TaxID=447716 RepID=A0A433V1H5_ANAVA|nr:hypothetical protein [Trichormus variabilis FACHB-164]RUS99943.1 hypothetical protein DSM107003_05270 [Trichormus variabilis SAG 1403-4b]